MNKTEIEKLATATAYATAEWLHDKKEKRPGFKQELFSESHLIIPVAEHLLDHGWCKLAVERYSETLFGKGYRGAYYDLDASRKDGAKLVFEMKLIKKGTSEQRIIKDLVKLAFPPSDSGYASLFLIAGSDDVSSNSKIIQDVLKDKKVTFNLPSSDDIVTKGDVSAKKTDHILVTQGDKPWNLTGDELKSVHKLMEADRKMMGAAPALCKLTVECAADKIKGNDRVIILSVQRE